MAVVLIAVAGAAGVPARDGGRDLGRRVTPGSFASGRRDRPDCRRRAARRASPRYGSTFTVQGAAREPAPRSTRPPGHPHAGPRVTRSAGRGLTARQRLRAARPRAGPRRRGSRSTAHARPPTGAPRVALPARSAQVGLVPGPTRRDVTRPRRGAPIVGRRAGEYAAARRAASAALPPSVPGGACHAVTVNRAQPHLGARRPRRRRVARPERAGRRAVPVGSRRAVRRAARGPRRPRPLGPSLVGIGRGSSCRSAASPDEPPAARRGHRGASLAAARTRTVGRPPPGHEPSAASCGVVARRRAPVP